MSQFQEKVELLRSEQLTSDIFRLTLSSPAIAGAAAPGQFVMVRTTEARDPLLRRPFSISQASSDGSFQILFKVLGRGTNLLAHCREGESLSVLGPLGSGFRLDTESPAVLIGGGMGIAPLLFLAKRLLRKGKTGAPQVMLGARNGAELQPLVDDFQTLGLRAQCATDDGSLGYHGLVPDCLRKMRPSPDTVVYCCGPRPMMAAVAAICKEQGLACQVSLETAMACGMGACLGCTVPMADGSYGHACNEGPVFPAHKVL